MTWNSQAIHNVPCVRRIFLGLLTFLLTTVAACNRPSYSAPEFHQDLRPYGLLTDTKSKVSGSFTELNFLSDNLILVSINQSFNHGGVWPSNSDQPASTLLLFDITRNALIKSADVQVEKRLGSVKATRDGQFVVLAESGIRACSTELLCGQPVTTLGPLWVSPKGTRLVVGGDGQTERQLLDSTSLAGIEKFTDISVIPGEPGLLIRRDRRLYLKMPGAPERLLPFAADGLGQVTLFLNDNVIASTDSDTSIAIAKLDGGVLYHLQALPWWDGTSLVRAESGLRFCVHESGYTRWNEIIHFYDIEKSRPRNLERVRVFDTQSGTERFELIWDPRPYIGYPTAPALTPDGHKLAIIRNWAVEVFEIQ